MWEQLQLLLTAALDEGEWLDSRPGHLNPEEKAPVAVEKEAG